MSKEVNVSGLQPWVTAVVTTYKRPQLAKRAIRSVLRQTYEPLETIVVEDGRDSGFRARLSDQGLDQVHYIRHEENRGLAAARNTGLRNARGRYVAYLDDDDEWLSTKLSKQMELAETKTEDWAIIYCGALCIGPNGRLLGENRPRLRGNIRAEIARKGLTTVPSSCLFLRKALEDLGGYDEAWASHIDHSIWMRLAQRGYKADHVNECLVKAHVHRGFRMTTDIGTRLRATEAFIAAWQPEWEKWFGLSGARKYSSWFWTRVLLSLGANCIDEGRVLAGLGCYWSAIRRDPRRIRSYVDSLASIAKVFLRRAPFYSSLRQLLRKPESSKEGVGCGST